jgi:hypothetical protein
VYCYVGAFKFNAVCVAVDIGLFKSEVLSTLPNPTILLVIPDTVPVNVGLANGATTPKLTATVPVLVIVPPVNPVPAVTSVTPCKSVNVGVNVPPSYWVNVNVFVVVPVKAAFVILSLNAIFQFAELLGMLEAQALPVDKAIPASG